MTKMYTQQGKYVPLTDECQKVQTLTRRSIGDAAAGLGLHFLRMSEGPFSHDAGHMIFPYLYVCIIVLYVFHVLHLQIVFYL